MIDNYIGSVDNEHHVTEYTLSTGKVITLTKEEADELCQYIDKANYASLVESLEIEVECLEEEIAHLSLSELYWNEKEFLQSEISSHILLCSGTETCRQAPEKQSSRQAAPLKTTSARNSAQYPIRPRKAPDPLRPAPPQSSPPPRPDHRSAHKACSTYTPASRNPGS